MLLRLGVHWLWGNFIDYNRLIMLTSLKFHYPWLCFWIWGLLMNILSAADWKVSLSCFSLTILPLNNQYLTRIIKDILFQLPINLVFHSHQPLKVFPLILKERLILSREHSLAILCFHLTQQSIIAIHPQHIIQVLVNSIHVGFMGTKKSYFFVI